MHYKVGDTVRVKNIGRLVDGRTGRIVSRNGEYYYVDVMMDGEEVTIEAYHCELIKMIAFEEELFVI